MAKRSAGLMMFRHKNTDLEVFLVHPGGPFWAKKDEGTWGIAKGETEAGEDELVAAQREFQEETGFSAAGPFLTLGTVELRSGKIIVAWAFEGDCDPAELRSNTCEIEWPPKSGRRLQIAEVDRGAWFTLASAARYIAIAQQPLLARLELSLKSASSLRS